MKPETLKKEIKKIDWHTWRTIEKMPFSQGYLINEVIKRYNIRGIVEVGYHLDMIAIKTRVQILAWKDTGIGGRFLGLINLDDGSIEQSVDDTKKQEHAIFVNKRMLWKEIEKRDYDKILGLKAKITEEEYMDALEALPPLKMIPNGFIGREAISDGMYMKYTRNPLICKVTRLEDEEIIKLETEY